MGLMITAILFLIVFYPGKTVLSIETPVWMIAYAMMVFRLLLLWRVATFPPVANINNGELKTLIDFDMSFWKVENTILPFSVWVFLMTMSIVVLVRMNAFSLLRKKYTSFIRKKPKEKPSFFLMTKNWISKIILDHIGISYLLWLIILTGLCFVIKMEILVRILRIVTPLVSYLIFIHICSSRKMVYGYENVKGKKYSKWLLSRLLMQWIETPVFFISLCTLGFLFVFDKGFGIIFLIFLMIKNIFLSFIMERKKQEPLRWGRFRLHPDNARLFGVVVLLFFLIVISAKSFVSGMLDARRLILIATVLLTIYIVQFVRRARKTAVRLLLLGPLLLFLAAVIIPASWQQIDDGISDYIRHVKFRTTMLVEPMTETLLKEKYKSGGEKKIIETAQSQWFIHNYLDTSTFFTDGRMLSFKPHFNKGVDYTTQTRDVVLARYVIPEFGGVSMWLLLALMTIPLLLFFITYRVQYRGVFDAQSLLAAISVLLLFSAALIVWMTSTNRFVFFGQDFPFLSVTSRISTMIPMILLFVLLTRKPLQHTADAAAMGKRIISLFLFFILVIFGVLFSGKSKLLDENNFKPDFSKLEARVNTTIDDYFLAAQNKHQAPQDPSHPTLVSYIGRWMAEIKKDPGYRQMLDTLSPYEKSMLEALENVPSMGRDERSPLHVIYENDEYHVRFNPFYHFELPVYNNRKVWKGDIYQEKPEHLFESGIQNAEVVVVPAAYLPQGEKSFALLDLIGRGKMQIYTFSTKKLEEYDAKADVRKLTEDELLFYRDSNDSMFATWSLSDGRRNYFVYNLRINGQQRMIYPLGKDFFWIRHWAQANKLQFERKQENYLDTSTTTNMDYELTRNMSQYLNETLRTVRTQKQTNTTNVIFSVTAADGYGRIRLMADHAMQRILIDPNNELEISRKATEEYFNRNNEAARLQWGNTNLLHMRLGPGSSIKPLLLSAVASQKKLEWERLVYKNQAMPPHPKKSQQFIIDNYAGLELPKKARNGWTEADYNNAYDVDLVTYLAKSNNIYHSLIVFLGSYKKTDFESSNSLLDQLKTHTSGFPKMSLGGTATYSFKDSLYWPRANESGRYFGNTYSMMSAGLNENMALQTYSGSSLGLLTGHDNYSRLDSVMPNKSIWSFPEKSYFNQRERVGNGRTLIDNFNNGLRQTTLGGAVFRLTPLQVMEMYGKLFNYDKDYRVFIDSANNHTQAQWVAVDPEWDGSFTDFLNSQVFKGMEAAITGTQSHGIGTGFYLNETSRQFPNYNFWAKTGTIGSGNDDNSKRLIVVISLKDRTRNIDQQKKYLVYFTIQNAYTEQEGFSNKNWFHKPVNDILRRIIESNTFKDYMKP